MTRPILLLTVLALGAAGPALAQDRGGLHLRGPAATLGQIEANRGCPLSSTTVATGVNRAFAPGLAASQQLGAATTTTGCRPLVSTQVAAGRPSFIGRPVIVTFVPGLFSLGGIPAGCSVLGPSASEAQVVTLPFLSVTSTSSHECGFVH